MRIGYFGGSFDPPHRGHLRVALAAMERFSLERVLLAPTGSQPFKPDGAAATFVERLEMVRLLVESHARVEASAIDAPHEDESPNYTVEALVRLRATLADADEVFAIVGVDAFAEFRKWREPSRLLELAEWIVVSRPGFDVRAIEAVGLSADERLRVHVLDGVAEDVSATELRAMLRDGDDVGDWLPQTVVDYIQSHGLYR